MLRLEVLSPQLSREAHLWGVGGGGGGRDGGRGRRGLSDDRVLLFFMNKNWIFRDVFVQNFPASSKTITRLFSSVSLVSHVSRCADCGYATSSFPCIMLLGLQLLFGIRGLCP